MRQLIQQIHKSLQKWFQFFKKWQKVMLEQLKEEIITRIKKVKRNLENLKLIIFI